MTIRIFGDSHAVAGFARIAEVDLHWVGPITMHRVGRDGADFLIEGVPIVAGDVLVFVFGEVDVRAHLCRIADITGRDAADLLPELVTRYVHAIGETTARFDDVTAVVTSVLPPAMRLAARASSDIPVHGSQLRRARLTRRLNRLLKTEAARHGLALLDYAELYANFFGGLRFRLSDGAVHVGSDHAKPIMQRLAALVGHDLTFLPREQAKASFNIERRTLAAVVVRGVQRALKEWRRERKAKRRARRSGKKAPAGL